VLPICYISLHLFNNYSSSEAHPGVGLEPPSPNRKLNNTNFVDKDSKR